MPLDNNINVKGRGKCISAFCVSSGFTLLEMAIVVLIAGILLSIVIQIYAGYMANRRVRVTYERMQRVEVALQKFYESQGRYPCPADLAGTTSGIENCKVGGSDGARMTYGNNTSYLGDTADMVYVGAVPYETLLLGIGDTNPYTDPPEEEKYVSDYEFVRRNDSLDDWGRKLTYIVPEALTYQATYKQEYASIGVIDESGVSLTEPENSAAWVLISHGDNGSGAYMSDGSVFSGSICEGIETHKNNCDLAGSNTTNGGITIISSLKNIAKGNNYFDDIVMFSSANNSIYWEPARNDPNTNKSIASRDIVNSNKGFVGIGNANPVEKLDITGGSMETDRIKAGANICDENAHCLDISGFVNACSGAGQVVNGIYQGKFTCASGVSPSAVAVTTNQDCGSLYVIGIRSNGTLICGMP